MSLTMAADPKGPSAQYHKSAEREYAPTAQTAHATRCPMAAIPCRTIPATDEARKDQACGCRRFRAYGRLTMLVAEPV